MSKRDNRLVWTMQTRYGIEPCCFKCGVLTTNIDMHHVDSTTKCFSPSRATSYYAYYKETEKCIPLCKECHMELHKANNGTHNTITAEFTMKWLTE